MLFLKKIFPIVLVASILFVLIEGGSLFGGLATDLGNTIGNAIGDVGRRLDAIGQAAISPSQDQGAQDNSG